MLIGLLLVVTSWVGGGEGGPDPAAIDRGREALTARSLLTPAWGPDAFARAGALWGGPDPAADPGAYLRAFCDRYGLNPAPFPNDGLPMGLKRATSDDGSKVGIQVDCLLCHGGSIGGTSYVGLGNSTVDIEALFRDLTVADGRKWPPVVYTLNTTRGTVNAGQFSSILLSMRNKDLSVRKFPLLLGRGFPEIDTPPWWNLAPKATMYYDGRTDADSVRTNMQFLLGEATLDRLKELEPTFRDIQAYIKSLTPPKYPFEIDTAMVNRGRVVFEKTCTKCHGTYDEGGVASYPSRIVELDLIGTDPSRARALTPAMVAHYNATWLGEEHPGTEEVTGYQAPPLRGIWATAPYLHNGTVPTLWAVLKSTDRPDRFRRPASTSLDHYDRDRVGWRFEPLDGPADPTIPAYQAKFVVDTSRYGLSNRGHTFGDDLGDDDRRAVVEYLKTL